MLNRLAFPILIAATVAAGSGWAQEREFAAALKDARAAGVPATLDRLASIARENATFWRAYQRLVTIAANSGALERARSLLEALPNDESRSPFIDYAWSVYHNHQKNWGQAEAYAKRSIERRPDLTAAYIEWITAARGSRREDALSVLLEAKAREDRHAEGARYALALRAIQLDRPEQAATYLGEVSAETLLSIEYSDLLYYCHYRRHNYGDAYAVLERMLAAAEKRQDSEWIGIVLGRMGTVNNDLGRIPDARDQLERAVVMAREIDNAIGERVFLSNLGLAEYYLGNYSVAMVHYSRALTLPQLDRRSEGRIAGLIAAIYGKLGEYSRAIEGFKKSAALAAAVGDRGSEADQMASLADIYLSAGDQAAARASIDSAISLARELKNPWLEGRFVQILGSIHTEAGQFAEAREAYAEAVRLTRAVRDQIGEAQAQLRAGEAELRLRRLDAALASYGRALEIGEQVGSRSLQGRAHVGLGAAHTQGLAYLRALEHLTIALGIATETRSREGLFKAHAGLAALARIQGRTSASLEHYRAALAAADEARATLVSPEYKAGYLSSKAAVCREFVDYLLALNAREPKRGYDVEAFAAAERNSARSYLDLITESQAGREADGPLPLTPEQRTLQAKLSQLHADAIQALSRARPDASDVQRLRADILRSDDEYQAALWEQRRQLQEDRGVRSPRLATVADVQASIGPRTALLKYWLGERRSVVFAISREKFAVFALADARTLGRDVAGIRRLTASQPQRRAQAGLQIQAASLYEKLVTPTRGVVYGKADLIIVPDGILHYLPFELLPAPSPAGTEGASTRLVEAHSIRYAPSAGVALALSEASRSRKAPGQGLLAYGDARYMRESEDGRATTRSPFFDGGRWSLRPLPESLREVESIRTMHERTGAVVRTGARATEESVKNDPALPDYRYIHFAVHGLLDEQRPRLSGIALSLPASAGSDPEDGLLHAYEVFHLKLHADVVVLSACETALGAAVNGEGLIGLTQAFLYAGASAVVASLWKVDDRATAEFMIRFHRHLRRADPSTALRLAKLEMIRSGIWAHPHYWAAFTLTGHSAPAPLQAVFGGKIGAGGAVGEEPQGVFAVREK